MKLISRIFFKESSSIPYYFPDQLEYVPDLNYLEEVKGFISGKKTEIRLVDQRNYTYGVDKKDNTLFKIRRKNGRKNKILTENEEIKNFLLKI